ncbi:tRNA pseudouridine(55) synthase TruB [Ferroacidibacillus organovorans]|uniref:tRNA pseudouridine synthase B n=1 Tax=Ferroacidibacillus organovorans TaxID=1765683 RepID=A0A853KDQ1_9BACL|nr:tRNA pseudouridine(55) synthase TruB [Ferroacidibacillus organovorans]KYP82188.1 hypothetical protein AYJ22_00625 [Ferroacidibacillus organovorans]OAG94474.1 hypothetical protein AYW79_05525 [Ferroacidibacillus organovorans]
MMHGVFVLNKPLGMTSQQAVTRVKRMLQARKAGHTGTLDPNVAGVLPVLLGSATRLSDYVMESEKAYLATAWLGSSTDTQDHTGRVLAVSDATHLGDHEIRDALSTFLGVTMQIPPIYSAIHVAGRRAHELARAGQSVVLEAREMVVHEITLQQITRRADSLLVNFSVRCGKGTYVRTLCHDLGVKLGVPAHMFELTRTKSGPFSLADAHSFDELERGLASLVRPTEDAVPALPKLTVAKDALHMIFHGAPLFLTDAFAAGQGVAFHVDRIIGIRVCDELVALYRVREYEGDMWRLTAHKVLVQQGVE